MERLIKTAIKKPSVKKNIPSFINSKLIIDEFEEHAGFIKWSVKRVILPLAVFYIATGFLFGEHVLGPLLMGLIIFLYANFLPDLDTFFPHNQNEQKAKSLRVKKRLALFFAPLIIYYLLSRKLKPWDLGIDKPFHNKRALYEFSIFLFLLGLLLYFSLLNAIFFMLFGFFGYFMHLLVDKKIHFKKIIE